MRRLFNGVLLIFIFMLYWPAFSCAQGAENADLQLILKELKDFKSELSELKTTVGQQREEIKRLKDERGRSNLQPIKAAEADREQLLKAAQDEISAAKLQEEAQEVEYTSGALGLQALNPEISITGDVLWSYKDGDAVEEHTDFNVRGLGMHLESYLDPYTRFKAAVSANENETELGEMYMTRFGVLPNLNFTLGKFRQNFGIVNRWHKHALDQVDFPLALRMIFGDGGLNQSGVSLDYQLPFFDSLSQELIFQITDGDNQRVFGENADNFPAFMVHLKNYHDLSNSTYLELGFSALSGRNDSWQTVNGTTDLVTENKQLWANVFGVDFTMLWEPTDRMRYRNVTWRSEAYFLNKDILAPDASGEDSISAWDMYSYLESKLTRTLYLGVRGDYFAPDTKGYADSIAANLEPVVVTGSNPYRWQVGPYLAWHQSPFVHFRVEYNHISGNNTGPDEDVIWLQSVFAAGPHKHERY